MDLLLQGILLGLILAVLVGPIFFTMSHLAIQRGPYAGFLMSTGVWVSDFMIVLGSYFFAHRMKDVFTDPVFVHWIGMVGGIVLLVFGIGVFFSGKEAKPVIETYRKRDYFSFWIKGFLINTLNPFTILFWMGVCTTYVVGKKINGSQALIFFGAILGMIITTDSLKVIFAKFIRDHMKPHHFKLAGKIAGIALFIFGIALLVRSQLY